ncbi:MurR/RpiR family transcriptional regulator [Frankia sp. CNm7]|uniref:MurR/RpiR family transcriptional regulator n=1 Tax=Frankia nepalensis TaxID=1836974 RepID=A0A937RF17_9ACTN|nr:MurR/RpiR family transcriptional regulator [Frankia nepalensis]MBL7495281.1 MurR/RpiR family transcriptional regulator [Frankia nepalensis]MBL7515540.1 MurR/RpiR family transcriptional regulator [Frankia nepalensis]MBL7524456.1 MurR/RpiR family transcriptional regulator [Frankia nepalensis]MBL7627790.1 MurR/RpiR family transcriptional regulator [Frankia nepalensis]
MVSSPPPSTGSLFATIRATLPTLIPSERRVAEACLLRPDEVVEWSAAQLAAAAEVSAATVVRACQSMGFRGFQQLRMAFAREAGAAGARPNVREPGPEDPPEQILDTVFEVAAAVLADSLAALDRSRLGPAVDLLDRAQRVLVVGNGGSSPVAQDAALRLMSGGRPAEAPLDAQTQQVAANSLTPADACLVISSSGVNELTARTAEIARGRGASIILITSYAAGPLTGLADVSLVVGVPHWPLGSDLLSGRLGSMLLIMTLQLAMTLRRQSAPGMSAEQLRELLNGMLINPRPSDERPA